MFRGFYCKNNDGLIKISDKKLQNISSFGNFWGLVGQSRKFDVFNQFKILNLENKTLPVGTKEILYRNYSLSKFEIERFLIPQASN